MIIVLPKIKSQFQVSTKKIMIKTQSKAHKQKDSIDDNLSNKYNESSSSDRKNEPDEKSRHKHGKPVNIPHHSHSNSDTDSESTYGGTTYDSTQHHYYNEYLTPFGKTNVS